MRPIVAFGDSMTRGHRAPPETVWPHLLELALTARLGNRAPRVINAGGNGNTSAEGLARIDNDVLAHQPSLVLVEFGGNDATKEPARHVSLSQFRANLEIIHNKISAIGATAALITFPPVVDRWHSLHNDSFYAPQGGIDSYVEQYRRATREEAARLGLRCFDMDAVVRQAANSQGWESLILSDGVHFTEAGNRLVADAIAAFTLPFFTSPKTDTH